MKAEHEDLNERLDGRLQSLPPSDPQVEGLVKQAQRLKLAPQLKVDADFARHLETSLLARSDVFRQRTARRGWWKRAVTSQARGRSFGAVAALCALFLFLLGVGVVMAAQSANPGSPLYGFKRWQQAGQDSVNTSMAQPLQHYQQARDRLQMLTGLVDPAGHSQAYSESLNTFERSLQVFERDVNELPGGSGREQFEKDLASLKMDARQALHKVLPHLPLRERASTTTTLAQLGEAVPQLTQITIISSSNGQVVITFEGQNIDPGVQLLVDGQLVAASGQRKTGGYTFEVKWGKRSTPESLGLQNPDGMVVLSNMWTWTTEKPGNSGNHGNGGGNNNGNGNGGGKGK